MMNYKVVDYTLTVAVSSKEALSIIQILNQDYKDLFKKSNVRINQTNNPNYSDLIVLDLEFKNGLYEDLINFENDLVKNSLLPKQWKIAMSKGLE